MTWGGASLPPDRLMKLDSVGFCRVCAPQAGPRELREMFAGDCNVDAHDEAEGGVCDRIGKRPVSTPEREDLTEVAKWVQNGGNVAIVLEAGLVCVDQDHSDVSGVVAPEFPESFTVRSGGGGAHSYFWCEDWDRGTVDLLNDAGEHVGEIRSGEHAIVIVPPSLHESGYYYDVLWDEPIQEVDRADLVDLADRFDGPDEDDDQDDDQDDDEDGASVDRGRVGGADLDELDRLVDHDGRREELRGILRDPDAGHSERQYLAGFLLDACGLSVGETFDIIDEFNRWSNYDRQVTREQVESVDRSTPGGGR